MTNYDYESVRREVFDAATADELDYGNVIGIAFSRGSGPERYRIGCPVSRDTAKALYKSLGRLLYPAGTDTR